MLNVEILNEAVVRFSQGEEELPGAPTIEKLKRWSRVGLDPGKDGQRVRLEWCWFGGHLATSMEAYFRFHKAVNLAKE